MTPAQNSNTEQLLALLYSLDQPSSYYGAVFPQRDLRGKELLNKLELTVRGFTHDESNVSQRTIAAGWR